MTGLPATIGRYRVDDRIGRGGMGTLFLAWDPSLERQVALKLLLDDSEEFRARFIREARSAARVHHPNIVVIYDVGEDDGRPFMAMEYIHGETLADIIRRREPMPTLRKTDLAKALVDGLAYAHRNGIIHRDIKPPNIMVDTAGTLKILDFGIARLAESSGMTRAGMAIGTLNYMSPEQLGGLSVDHRTDIFSVGAVCYELFSNRQAFPGGLDAGVLQKLLAGQIEPLSTLEPGLDPEIVRIVHRCLEPDREKRYQDLGAVQTDLARVRRRLALNESSVAVAPRPPTSDEGRGHGSGDRFRRLDFQELARRRASQIQAHLTSAAQAYDGGQFEAAIAECERALIIDADQVEAVELLDRARTAVDERQAEQLLAEAEADMRRGALAAAVARIDQATALNPRSPRAADVRRMADEALRERERVRQRAEAVRGLLLRAHESFDKAQFADAVSSVDQALALEPDHPEATSLRARARDAIEAQAREELARRARDSVREARRRFSQDDHAGAIDLLERFEPKDDFVSQALVELRAESIRLTEQRRLEAEERARRQRIEAELVRAKGDIDRQEFDEALERLQTLTDAEGASTAIEALERMAHAGRAETERAEQRAREIADAVARAAGLLARREFSGALSRVEEALALQADHQAALAMRSRIQDGMQTAVDRREAREERRRQREAAIAAAIAEAGRASSDGQAIQALYGALELDPEHRDLLELIAARDARLAHEEADRRRIREADGARHAKIDHAMRDAREALSAGQIGAARRALGRAFAVEPDSLDAQWLGAQINAVYGEAFDADASEPAEERPAPPPSDAAGGASSRPADTLVPEPRSASALRTNAIVLIAIAAIVILLLWGWLAWRG